MSTQKRSLASRLYAGLGRVTWGYLRKKVNERFSHRDEAKTQKRR